MCVVFFYLVFFFFSLHRAEPRELQRRFGVSPEYLCANVNLFECVIEGDDEDERSRPIAAFFRDVCVIQR